MTDKRVQNELNPNDETLTIDFNETHHLITGLTIQEYNVNMAISGILCGFTFVFILLLFISRLK